MGQSVGCNACGQKFKAHEKFYGKKVKCPKCQAVIQIPMPRQNPPANDLSDLLDDELKPQEAPAEETAAPRSRSAKKCSRCGDELVPDSAYCVACGYNNIDADAKLGQVAMQYHERQQKIGKMGRERHWLVQALFFWGRY